MTRAQAISEARAYADRALRGIVGVLSDAVEYRRTHPHRFALFHQWMADHWARRGKRARARWHRYWQARYSARAWALAPEIARDCGVRR